MNVKRKLKTLKKLIIHNPRGIWQALGQNGLLNFLPDKRYIHLVYWSEIGKKLNIDDPQTYNEKLQWLKLYDRNPLYTTFADKYAVRSYIKNTIGEQYLVPLIGVYNCVDEILWNMLPNSFVLKCTNGCGSNIICRDKTQLDIMAAKKQLSKWMKSSAFKVGREWSYKNIVPRIICENFIETTDGKAPIDYKFMCFNGETRLIQVHKDRYGNHTLDFYDAYWNKTTIRQGTPNSDSSDPPPKNLTQMMEIAHELSRGTYYARIDLYNENDIIYFGEITLYPTSGFTAFEDEKDDILLGSWIDITKK